MNKMILEFLLLQSIVLISCLGNKEMTREAQNTQDEVRRHIYVSWLLVWAPKYRFIHVQFNNILYR